MFPPSSPKTERTRIRTEREYREWQLSLRGTLPVKRFNDKPGFLARLMKRITAPQLQPVAEIRRVEQKPC